MRTVLAMAFMLFFTSAATDAQDSGLRHAADGLSWRLIGPFRAGWGEAVTGVPGAPNTFYSGAAGGGVWKTTDAGHTWTPIFDDGPASIGAIAVAPSNPNVIYVGTGQVTTRYDVAAGEGVYRSNDGGKSWVSVGLKKTQHIGKILIDPRNPDTVLVAAAGHVFGPNAERGVYRSTDGGKNWEKTLFVSDRAGATDLAADPSDPQIVFASTWQMRGWPWLAYFMPNSGPDSGVFKSTDGGAHWTRIKGGGWPEGESGRIGLAVTRTAAGTRVYATLDARGQAGLYRSDDGGATWSRVNEDGSLAGSYFARLAVMPNDPDTVLVTGRSIRRCEDGGRSCKVFKGSPGGDDYHDIWIDPRLPQQIITGSDQGSVVSVDGGAHWSSWYNQPTAQLYHLAADNQFPYWIYAGQQDNGTFRIASRSDYGLLTFRDWSPVGADERDYDIPDPVDPNIVYGSGLGGRLTRWNARNGERQNISPTPIPVYGVRPSTVKYHYNWITPIAVSSVTPFPLYQGAQVLFRSLDRGQRWEVISPDLSAKKEGFSDCGGNVDPARARDCGFGVINSIALSSRSNDEIWIGTDDGLVQLTRNGGGSWSNITPAAVPGWSKIASVDLGPTAGSAYIAVDNHRQDDFTPRIFRTRDFGHSWTSIAAGLPGDQFVSVVRTDPEKDGLLYAGTNRGVFVSFDDGARWFSLQRNLPSVIVTDLLVHQDDLIVGTMGRAVWILDHLAPLRQATAIDRSQPATLMVPAAVVRVRPNQNYDTPLPPEEPVGQNPPEGAAIDYLLAADANGPVEIEIRDAQSQLIRRFSSSDKPVDLPSDKYFAEGWLKPAVKPAKTAGFQRFFWDLYGERPKSTGYEYSIAGVWGRDTALQPRGLLALPGDYKVTLRVDGREYSQSLRLLPDPRVPFSQPAAARNQELARQIGAALAEASELVDRLGMLQAPLAPLEKEMAAKGGKGALAGAVAELRTAVDALTEAESEENTSADSIAGGLNGILIDLEGTDAMPTEPQELAVSNLRARLAKAQALWSAIQSGSLPKLNKLLQGKGKKPLKLESDKRLGHSPGEDLP